MSRSNPVQNVIYSQDLPALVAGVVRVALGSISIPKMNTSFFPSISRVLGCVRKTAGGTPGNPLISFGNSSSTGTGVGDIYVQASSDNASDTSVYTVFWVNEWNPSLLPC